MEDRATQHPLRPFLALTAGTALGEAVGLLLLMVVGDAVARAAAAPGGAPPAAALALVMALAGLAEGACIGLAQAAALGPGSGVLDRPGAALRWVLATTGGVALAWGVGMLGSTVDLGRSDGEPTVASAAAWGLVVGAAAGLAQSLVWRFARRTVPGWGLTSALAWGAGMGAGSVLTRLGPAGGTEPLAQAALAGAHGLAVGAVVGAIQGAALSVALAPRGDAGGKAGGP